MGEVVDRHGEVGDEEGAEGEEDARGVAELTVFEDLDGVENLQAEDEQVEAQRGGDEDQGQGGEEQEEGFGRLGLAGEQGEGGEEGEEHGEDDEKEGGDDEGGGEQADEDFDWLGMGHGEPPGGIQRIYITDFTDWDMWDWEQGGGALSVALVQGQAEA